MSYNSRAAGEADFRSGGKIVRQRRLASSRTPYDRPEPRPAPPPVVHKSNWLSAAGRVLVTGAGKLISTVIGSDTSSSDSDWGSDDEADSHDGRLDSEPQQVIFSSESKQKIEELIRQETFSRGECDALIQIIRSRTVDAITLADMHDTHMDDHRDTAVMEARKWIDERKNETGSTSHLEHGSGSLSSLQITKEAGSPIDVARTYMQARPPWASPTANLLEIRSPTHVKIQTLTDGAVLSSRTKKRESLASGSWSIAEEMRKVRARATDKLLSTPSRKFDLSDFSLNHDTNSDTVKNGLKENLAGSSSFTLALAAVADKGADSVAEVPTCTRSPALETTGEGPQQGPLSCIPGTEMGQMASASSCKRTEGVALHEDTNGLEGDISASANDFRGVPSMAEGVTIELNSDAPGHHGNPNEEIPNHTSQAASGFSSKQESEFDAFKGGSKQTSNEEPTLDASKSSPEVLLAVEATKKQHRVKQPVRVGRGRDRGK